MIKVSCIGLGHRGFGYLEEMQKYPDVFEIVSLCETNEVRLNQGKEKFGVKPEMCFKDENDFFKTKISDLVIVSTQDQQHVGHAIKALRLGCDVLCEKPISNRESECRKLLKVQQETGKNVFVCHVLRYSPAFFTVKKMIDDGEIGRLIMIDSIENVGFYHQAHSFVRGNWRNSIETSPMVIAKCCHDLDLLTWYAKSKCKSISSIGELTYFKKENQPEGAASRCLNCKFKETCPYSAYSIYMIEKHGQREYITDERPVTDEAVMKALENGPYGRCVFECDNNVVDHEITMMTFENGIQANLRFTAFTKHIARCMKFYGTKAELILDEENEQIILKPFGPKEQTIIPVQTLNVRGYNHGGGDTGIIIALRDFYSGNGRNDMSTLEASTESHLMGFAAEKSRVHGGKVIQIKH